MSAAHEVTQLLAEWANGDQQALHQLTPLVYAELRQLAAGYLRNERRDHTLQPTALVHEAYLRLVDQRNLTWQNRSHFLGVAAHLMRRILVDHARRGQAAKRAGRKVSLEHALTPAQERTADVAALDDALRALEKLDARKCRAVELSYFGGLSVGEIARALKVSPMTVRQDLKMAEAWLYREIRSG
jgi:RNA polymerase sigma-70 factor, ECF subfamily